MWIKKSISEMFIAIGKYDQSHGSTSFGEGYDADNFMKQLGNIFRYCLFVPYKSVMIQDYMVTTLIERRFNWQFMHENQTKKKPLNNKNPLVLSWAYQSVLTFIK